MIRRIESKNIKPKDQDLDYKKINSRKNLYYI